jgi:hypothetical protein
MERPSLEKKQPEQQKGYEIHGPGTHAFQAFLRFIRFSKVFPRLSQSIQ